jgi:hypothetical protein
VKPRAWGDYTSRGLASLLLFGAGFALFSTSTFVLRMRNDIPLSFAGLDGPQSLALILAGLLSIIPILMGRRFLGAFLVCGWIVTGIGGYWWTTIPWDELITDSDFPSSLAPGFWDYALVAGPALITTLYVVLARVSQVRADAKGRGIEAGEASRAASVAFLTGAVAIVLSLVFVTGMWMVLSFGVPMWSRIPLPTGIPALLLCAAVVVLAWFVGTRRVGGGGPLRKRALKKVGSAPARKAMPSEAAEL